MYCRLSVVKSHCRLSVVKSSCRLSVVKSYCRLSVVKSYCGHGIGDLFHCAPNVPHYSQNKVSISVQQYDAYVSSFTMQRR
jgi:methionine aminopeptidase